MVLMQMDWREWLTVVGLSLLVGAALTGIGRLILGHALKRIWQVAVFGAGTLVSATVIGAGIFGAYSTFSYSCRAFIETRSVERMPAGLCFDRDAGRCRLENHDDSGACKPIR